MLYVWNIYLQNWVIFGVSMLVNIPAPWILWVSYHLRKFCPMFQVRAAKGGSPIRCSPEEQNHGRREWWSCRSKMLEPPSPIKSHCSSTFVALLTVVLRCNSIVYHDCPHKTTIKKSCHFKVSPDLGQIRPSCNLGTR